MICPACHGVGKIQCEKERTSKQKHNLVVKLKKAGLSHRQIQHVIGYKSPASITKILRKKT